ncbi:MAG: ATP-binding protein [Longimicrobiales bacterium]
MDEHRDMDPVLRAAISQRAPTQYRGRTAAGSGDGDRRVRELIDALPTAIYTTDAEGRLTHFNPAAVEFSGRTPELGTDHWCVSWKLYRTDGSPLPHDQCPMAIALREGRSMSGEEAIAERPDGKRIWFAAYPTALRDENGRLIGGVNMLIDITERRRTESLVLEQKMLLELIASGRPLEDCFSALCAAVSRLEPGTRAWVVLAGDEPSILPRSDAPDPLQASVDGPSSHVAAIPAADGGTLGSFVLHFQRPRAIGEWEQRLLHIGTHVGCIAIERDRAARRERRIRAEAEAARAEAEQANQAKSAFLATMSHELRTPLNAIMGYRELLDAELGGPLTEPQREQLDRIDLSARHLLRLIEEILTFARIEAGREQVQIEPFDLAALASETAALVEPLARKKGLAFHCRTPGTVRIETDPDKLRQILLNLLSNAIKFTDQGEVRLELSNGGKTAVLRVDDTGIGIPPEHLERIFQPFSQAEPVRTRRVGGTGLGLSVTRQLARLLGGDVTVESERGSGSCFTLRLPLRPESTLG